MDRKLLVVVWVAFLGDLVLGAGLTMSRDGTAQVAGIVMLLVAAVGLVGFTLYYYVQNKRRASP